MSVNLGWTVAPALGGLLVGLGWHWLFIIDGITCILAAILLWLLIAPKPAPPSDAADHPLKNPEKPAKAVVSPYRDKPFLVFILLTVLNALVFMQFIWTVPIFFKDGYHWDEHTIGLLAALNGLIVFLVEMPLIYRIEGRRSRLAYVRLGSDDVCVSLYCFFIAARRHADSIAVYGGYLFRRNVRDAVQY